MENSEVIKDDLNQTYKCNEGKILIQIKEGVINY